MKHFHRTHVNPDAVMLAADSFFPMRRGSNTKGVALPDSWLGGIAGAKWLHLSHASRHLAWFIRPSRLPGFTRYELAPRS